MTKIKNNSPQVNITTTNQIKYVGDIPTCALTGDCSIDETNLTYLISILLTRYCSENNVIDADLSSVDLTCLIASNPDIEIPDDVTIETLSVYYKDHFCALYSKVSDLQDLIDSLKGITCLNDIVQLDQNDSIVIDPLFNDITDEVTGTVVVTIISAPINGTATVATNKITYTPNEDFFGNDQITYQVAKGGYTCSAKISIKVNEVVSTQTITEIVIEQITDILQSDEYWDIGLDVGTKLSVTESKLAYFNLVGGSWGAGLPGTRYSKWAIANGNNGTDDERGLTTRGFDVNNIDYNDTSSSNSGGSDSITLDINNIPPHKHSYAYQTMEFEDCQIDGVRSAGGGYDFGDDGQRRNQICSGNQNEGTGSGKDIYQYENNTSDGTDNINNVDELQNTPSNINIRNAYFTEIKIQKIL